MTEITENTNNQINSNPKKRLGFFRILLSICIAIVSAFLFSILIIIFLTPSITQIYLSVNHLKINNNIITDSIKYSKELKQIELENKKLTQKLNSFIPHDAYLIVNTTANRFKLYHHQKLIRQGFCSTGSYTLLKGHDKREWIFKTPKGYYSIHGKVTSPVWWRPDWSFVEEGLPVPPRNHPSRWEAGVLGDYALSIGDGYLIHGTLYKRFLGMPVTHGCIRMNDDDLEAVFKNLDIGSKVYIY